MGQNHSHSIVPGGLLFMSYTTRSRRSGTFTMENSVAVNDGVAASDGLDVNPRTPLLKRSLCTRFSEEMRWSYSRTTILPFA